MPRPGPIKGVSKWRWYLVKREKDGKYFTGAARAIDKPDRHGRQGPVYRFGKLEDARAYRLKEAFTMLCRIRRQQRIRERYFNYGRGAGKKHKRQTFLPPTTYVLEVRGDPKAEIKYPWEMPM